MQWIVRNKKRGTRWPAWGDLRLLWVVAAHPTSPLPCLVWTGTVHRTVLSGSWLQVSSIHGEKEGGGGHPDVAGKGRLFQVLPAARTSAALRGQFHPEPASECFTPWRALSPWSSACIFPQASCSCQRCLLPPGYYAFSKVARVPALLSLVSPLSSSWGLQLHLSSSHPPSPFLCSEEYFASYQVFVLNVHSSP